MSPLLRELHRLRRLARDLQADIDRAPTQLRVRKAATEKLQTTAKQSQDHLKQLKVTIRDRETTLKQTAAQVERYRSQIDNATDFKQHDALQHQITHGEQQMAKLEEEVFALMEQVDSEAAALPGHEASAKKATDETAAFERGQKEKLARHAEELKKTTGLIAEQEALLPAEVAPLVKRLIAAYGADGLAAVEGNVCTNCQTQSTAQQKADLEAGHFVTCKNCYRGLYLPE